MVDGKVTGERICHPRRLVLLVDGDILEFTIPDISKLATYVVVVEQAAARGTYALIDPSGYNISLRVK